MLQIQDAETKNRVHQKRAMSDWRNERPNIELSRTKQKMFDVSICWCIRLEAGVWCVFHIIASSFFRFIVVLLGIFGELIGGPAITVSDLNELNDEAL